MIASDSLPPPSAGQNEIVFPQVANGQFAGGSFVTTLVFVNRSEADAVGEIEFFRSDGSPFALTLTDSRTGSSFDLEIPAAGALFLQTDGLVTGLGLRPGQFDGPSRRHADFHRRQAGWEFLVRDGGRGLSGRKGIHPPAPGRRRVQHRDRACQRFIRRCGGLPDPPGSRRRNPGNDRSGSVGGPAPGALRHRSCRPTR